MNSLLIGLRRDNIELRSELDRVQDKTNRRLNKINRNVMTMLTRPGIRAPTQQRAVADAVTEQQEEQEPSPNVSLSKMPKTLNYLWMEYEFGLNNKKAAKDFSSVERGRVKYRYHRRKVVWDKISEMVRAGHNSEDAINKIYDAYGHKTSVTNIINKMRKDRKDGGHPNLQVAYV